MKHKVVLGIAAAAVALPAALGIGLYAAQNDPPQRASTAESRPPKDGEIQPPPPPPQLKPSERVVVISK